MGLAAGLWGNSPPPPFTLWEGTPDRRRRSCWNLEWQGRACMPGGEHTRMKNEVQGMTPDHRELPYRRNSLDLWIS